MLKRNRNRQTTTLEDRLIKFAEDARAAANRASPGRERDALIKKAEKAEAISTAAERLLYADAAFGKADCFATCCDPALKLSRSLLDSHIE
jgi:hypothetical protein